MKTLLKKKKPDLMLGWNYIKNHHINNNSKLFLSF